jgi:hypothetical protein
MSLVLNVEILGEFRKLTTATQGAQGSLAKLQEGVGGIARGIGRTVGAIAVALGFTSIIQGFKDSVAAAEEAKVANERIDAIAKSMDLFGAQTKQTTDRIKEFADSNEILLGVEAEVIKATQAKLLTFKELAISADTVGGAFDRATILAQDLAAAGFGEATANATQLGKALNDPIAGISSLTRVGLTFTDHQKEFIATLVASGDMVGAQNVILGELERQVGGTAAATVTSSEKMSLAFGAVQEAIGVLLLPVMDDLSMHIVEMAPKIEAFFKELDNPNTENGRAFLELQRIFEHTGQQFLDMMSIIANGDITWKDTIEMITWLTAAIGTLLFMFGRFAETQLALSRLDFVKAIQLQVDYAGDLLEFTRSQGYALQDSGPGSMRSIENAQAVTININNGNVTAEQIANTINRQNRATGTNLIRGQ